MSKNTTSARSHFAIYGENRKSRHLGVSHKPPKNVGSKFSRKQVPSQALPQAPCGPPVDAPVSPCVHHVRMWVWGWVCVCAPNPLLIEIAPIEWFRLRFWDISRGEKGEFTRKWGGNMRGGGKRGKKRTRSRNNHYLETERSKTSSKTTKMGSDGRIRLIWGSYWLLEGLEYAIGRSLRKENTYQIDQNPSKSWKTIISGLSRSGSKGFWGVQTSCQTTKKKENGSFRVQDQQIQSFSMGLRRHFPSTGP